MRTTTTALALAGTLLAVPAAMAAQKAEDPPTPTDAALRAPLGGHLTVRGEMWQARTEDGGELEPGEEVDVVAIDGLSLVVRRARETVRV